MSVERIERVTWTCDLPGCDARYEGDPPIGGVPPGFVSIRVEPSVMEPQNGAGGTYCVAHSKVVVSLLKVSA